MILFPFDSRLSGAEKDLKQNSVIPVSIKNDGTSLLLITVKALPQSQVQVAAGHNLRLPASSGVI